MSEYSEGNYAVFPLSVRLESTDDLSDFQRGLTYRQWLIGMALQGFCTNPEITNSCNYESIAHKAIRQVNALIEVLDKESELTP